jgi:hypothetical protein
MALLRAGGAGRALLLSLCYEKRYFSSPFSKALLLCARYGQEEPGERLEILQQPLALGYLTSTAHTGTMPRW